MAASPPFPSLTVVICTYNPRAALLDAALAALAAQSLPSQAWDLLVIDNKSSPPVDETALSSRMGRAVSVVREERQGLVYARACAIAHTRSELLCFVDDDNELAPDYLETAVKIAAGEPRLGVFGGIAEGVFETAVAPAKAAFLPFLGVRDHGPQPLTGDGEEWGPYEPIGAGICLRRTVAEAYRAFVEDSDLAGGLGRSGGALLCGEDSLISRIAGRLGFLCGYRPALRLRHHIPANRLSYRYLARLMDGFGQSHVLLEEICGRRSAAVTGWRLGPRLLLNFLHRLRHESPAMAVGMFFWDRGYFKRAALQGGNGLGEDRLASAVAGAQSRNTGD